jgi:hypothetical protein
MNLRILPLAVITVASPALASDPYPEGTIAHFNRSTGCPAGWSVYQEGVGRTVLPFPPEYAGAVIGEPLASGAQTTHAHSFKAPIDPGAVSYAAAAGGGNHSLANDNKKTAAGATDPSGINVPYVQYLVCRKDDAPSDHASAPSNVVVFTDAETGCPGGWVYADRLNGRLVVGLPTGGVAEAAFGGDALAPGQFYPQHTHTITKKVELKSYGVEAARGGLAKGYGKRGTYTAEGTMDSVASAFPYVMLVPCQAP